MGKNGTKKMDKKVKLAIDYFVKKLYEMSADIFMAANKKMEEYRKAENMPEKSTLDENTARGIVDQVFQSRFREIIKQSEEIGKKMVRVHGVTSAANAWMFVRGYLVEKEGRINNVPIIWNGVNDYFLRFSFVKAMLKQAFGDQVPVERIEESKGEEYTTPPLCPEYYDKVREENRGKYKDGEPCDHTGCLHHITHPCEGCGRIAGYYPEDLEKVNLEEMKKEMDKKNILVPGESCGYIGCLLYVTQPCPGCGRKGGFFTEEIN